MDQNEEKKICETRPASNMCRGCMIKLEPDDSHEDEKLAGKFFFCTNLDTNDANRIPKLFCRVCGETINLCYRFITEAQRVDQILRSAALGPVKADSNFKSECMDYEFLENTQDENITDHSQENQYLPEACTTKKEEKEESVFLGLLEVENIAHCQENRYLPEACTTAKEEKEESVILGLLEDAQKRRRKTSNESPINCQYCHKPFSTNLWYKKHLVAVHADNTSNKFPCKLCTKSFSRSDILKQHMVTHSEERPHACHLCPKRFKLRKQLNLHLRMHAAQKKYECEQCDATFQWRAVLINHMKVHYEEKTNLCHLCGTGFTFSGNLAAHMRTHTGEKPFACAHCAFKCNNSSSLRRHERTHTGHRPHACPHCDKRFTDRATLARHIRTHTGELPYPCKFCSRAFIDSSKRKRHVLSQHQVAAISDCRDSLSAK